MPEFPYRQHVPLRAAEVAHQLGVAASTLRAWDRRYGIGPTVRSPGMHRRYSPGDVQRLRELRDLVGKGIPTAEAASLVSGKVRVANWSIHAQLRQQYPGMTPAPLSKRALIDISRAIEDEWGTRNLGGVLVGGFQHEYQYRRVQHRWSQLCRGDTVALTFADFAERRDPEQGPTELPLDDDSPLLQEWFLVAVAPSIQVVLAGWERPATAEVVDLRRTFETLWTVRPDVVAAALRLTARLAQDNGPDLMPVLQDAASALTITKSDSQDATTALTNRMVAYVAGVT